MSSLMLLSLMLGCTNELDRKSPDWDVLRLRGAGSEGGPLMLTCLRPSSFVDERSSG